MAFFFCFTSNFSSKKAPPLLFAVFSNIGLIIHGKIMTHIDIPIKERCIPLKYKQLSSVLLSLITLSSLSLTTMAVAASHPNSSYSYFPTKMTINGHTVETPSHIAAIDPMSPNHNKTSFVPIWYVQQLLFYAGVFSNWNGHTLNLITPYPASITPPSTSQTLGSNVMDITVTHGPKTDVAEYAPMIQYQDAGTTTLTTYVPIWYLMQTMKEFGATTSWNGTGLVVNLKFPDGWVAPVLTQHWNSSMTNSQVQKLFDTTLGINGGALTVPAEYNNQRMPMGINPGGTAGMTNELVDIAWNAWGPLDYAETNSKSFDLGEEPGYYRIPIITADVFRFYFGSNWYKMVTDLASGKMPELAIINGMYVTTAPDGSGGIDMQVSVPGKMMPQLTTKASQYVPFK